MKDNLIPIGKMAAMNRISIPTLRLYDEKGLLKPRYVDPKTGYRYYDINLRHDRLYERTGHEPVPNLSGAAKGRYFPH